jgi:hypothetical protein
VGGKEGENHERKTTTEVRERTAYKLVPFVTVYIICLGEARINTKGS